MDTVDLYTRVAAINTYKHNELSFNTLSNVGLYSTQL